MEVAAEYAALLAAFAPAPARDGERELHCIALMCALEVLSREEPAVRAELRAQVGGLIAELESVVATLPARERLCRRLSRLKRATTRS